MNFALSTGYSADWLDNADAMSSSGFQADQSVTGDSQTMPTQSDSPQVAGPSWSGIHNLLGAIGTTARDLGTAVGSVKNAANTAKGQYNTAQQNAASGNKLGQWWQYSSTTDKIMVGIGVAGLVLVLRGHK